jgi:hypothetical protein
MTMIPMPDLSENSFVSLSAKIKDKTYEIIIRWDEYSQTAFMQISQSGEDLLEGYFPLVCNGVINIDHRILQTLFFLHKDGLDLAPIRETFLNYGLAYED